MTRMQTTEVADSQMLLRLLDPFDEGVAEATASMDSNARNQGMIAFSCHGSSYSKVATRLELAKCFRNKKLQSAEVDAGKKCHLLELPR
ncbi:hypothetical protein GCM10023156_41100 [Novipirellula rosea]|uniref:Uncharacterized protein n=1 Tax=Novipirellula rosea TaxID=1031540 RepID=A0ABP8N5T6_9BACT